MSTNTKRSPLLVDDYESAYDRFESLQECNAAYCVKRSNRRVLRSSDFPERIDFFGNPLCRWCCGLVFKPRRTFCTNACGKQVRIRTSAGALRDEVFDRDKGRCCKCEAQSLRLWEADHIEEITDGGDAFDMQNLQTLCIPCHKIKTAASRRNRSPRSYKIGAEFSRAVV